MVLDFFQKALSVDSEEDSKALMKIVESKAEIVDLLSEFFIYMKGASIFRMIAHAFGHNNFNAALKSYINETLVINYIII